MLHQHFTEYVFIFINFRIILVVCFFNVPRKEHCPMPMTKILFLIRYQIYRFKIVFFNVTLPKK